MKLVVALLISIAIACPMNAWADSKSATLRVSCTVLPMIEMRHQKEVSVNSNLQNRYQATQTLSQRGDQRIQLTSITAL